MTLLVDIGNSRVKWARFENGVLGVQHAAIHAGWSAADWRERLFGDRPAGSVLAATVAGGASADALREAARTAGAAEVQFATTRAEAAGVRNGYAIPSQLGVDRWLAVIGAHHLVRRACVVADVGTAATVDVVAADGRHGGGFIVPGPALMVSALVAGTSDLGARHADRRPDSAALWADNTRHAMERGAHLALAALLDRCVAEAGAGGTGPPALVLTGGAGCGLRPYLRSAVTPVPDLVLRGLAALLATGSI
jgi:type III pantothenate kinase